MARASTQRKRRARPPAQQRAAQAEDLMFFPKLRRRAKWVFLFLAIAFAGSFVFFGVGAGGSGIGDYLSDILNRQPGTDTPSLDNAREAVAEKPNDPAAQLDLAKAAQAEGEIGLSIAAYEAYRELKPEDSDAMRTLAALYGRQISEAQQRAAIASNAAAEATLPNTLAPEDSQLLQEITGNPLTEAVSAQLEGRANAANAEVQRLAVLQIGVFTELAELVDDDPLLFLQFASAAETAQDYASAITAYEAYLDLQPNSPNADQIEERIDALKVISGVEVPEGVGTGSGDESGGG
jgi:cytochrome c-type biogenesis protein CcmH/NrfG